MDDSVSAATCKVMHAQLERACDERHAALGGQIKDLTAAVRGLGDRLVEVVEARASDRAWSILGKIVVAIGSAYLVFREAMEAIVR